MFQLESYLTNGVERVVKGIWNASLKNPGESIYIMQYAKYSKKAGKLRKEAEERGEHIPPFLIASITNRCNLHCKGCYARANHSCFDSDKTEDPALLTANQWEHIFEEASSLGIGFILLAGGEPFVRKDVLIAAAGQKKILFPIFTNGTMIDEFYLKLLSANRNLIPVLSLEGSEKSTDQRRGNGIFQKLQEIMQELKRCGILFGVSITVHNKNVKEVLSDEFTEYLKASGCKGVVYVEYVPVDRTTKGLALDDRTREYMAEWLEGIRSRQSQMLFISFPGDEKSSGGCLAAGRGFFHINACGGAEPCPFSPYSDTSLTQVTLKEALRSPLFLKLQENGSLLKEHMGGCVLAEQQEEVEKLLKGDIA